MVGMIEERCRKCGRELRLSALLDGHCGCGEPYPEGENKANNLQPANDRLSLSSEEWAVRICTQLGKTAESIIQTGRLLLKAKADLSHGEWEGLFDGRVPIGIRSAQMFMAIAEHPLLTETKRVSFLPPSWGTLYELTTVEPKRLTAAFEEGAVTPEMTRGDVRALKKKARRSKTKRVTLLTDVQQTEQVMDKINPEKLPLEVAVAFLKRYLDNHCANADVEGMSTLCECKLCLEVRTAFMAADYAIPSPVSK